MNIKIQNCTFFEICKEASEQLDKCTGGSDSQPPCREDIGPGQDAFLNAVYCSEFRRLSAERTGVKLDKGPIWSG